MATRVDLPPLPPFDALSDQSSLSQRWKTWIKRFETYIVATNITDDKQKRAMLLYQAGPDMQDIFETLEDTGEDYITAKTKLAEYFSPKKNVDYEIFQFRQAVQTSDETVEQFATRLRRLAANCEFADVKKEVKSAIIQHCLSKRLRRFALREVGLTLDTLLTKARSLEASEVQAVGMEEKLPQNQVAKDEVNYVGNTRPEPRQIFTRSQFEQTSQPHQTCRKCGQSWPHRGRPCPANGQTCRKCGKLNHYAKVCMTSTSPRSKQKVNQIIEKPGKEESSDSDDEYVYSTGNDQSKIPKVTVQINSVDVSMIVDTGASTDIIDEDAFGRITQHSTVQLGPTTKRLFAYGSKDRLSTLGQFEGEIECQQAKRQKVTIQVLRGNHGSLLSYKTALALGILDLHINQIKESPLSHDIENKFPDLFNGIGRLKDVEVQLHIDSTVEPVAQRARRIPFHIRKKVETELSNLEQQGIIERADGPTPWVSPLVVAPKKDGGVRICVDMRMANRAIKREQHPIPTMDDLAHILNGATVFSKLDLRSGYHQLTLAPESRYITTFATHKGLWRYNRLNFSTSSASEIFQSILAR